MTGSLVKLSQSIFKEFILCFQSSLCILCTISSGLRVQFRHLLANLRNIYQRSHNLRKFPQIFAVSMGVVLGITRILCIPFKILLLS